jgi:hypothetical protein
MLQASDRKTSPGQHLTLDGITHNYGAGLAVDNVTLEIAGGELVALLGPSGCGKTTLLRIVAGFVAQTEGHVVIGERVVDDLPANRRDVGIVFQNYALFPHMTSPMGSPRAACRAPSRRGASTRCSASCRCAISPTVTPNSSPAGSSSAWRLPARLRSARASCCSTSRSPRSTRTSASTCRSRSSASSGSPAPPPSW